MGLWVKRILGTRSTVLDKAAVCFASLADLLTWTGCGSQTQATFPHQPCAKGPAAPITLAQARKLLVDAGYEPTIDPSLCELNGPGANQGDLSFHDTGCTVYISEPPRQKKNPHTRYEGLNFSGKAYVVAYENLDCWIYAGGSDRSQVAAALRGIFWGVGATGGAKPYDIPLP